MPDSGIVVMTDMKQAEGSEGVRRGGKESNWSSGVVTEANWAFNLMLWLWSKGQPPADLADFRGMLYHVYKS